MKIGVLNDILPISLSYAKADGSVPVAKESGDPLRGEQLLIHWQQVMEGSLYFSVALSAPCFLSDVWLKFGERGAPHTITVWDARRTRVLYHHTAETGENIAKKELSLPIGEELSCFVIELAYYFSYTDILHIKLFGAKADTPLLLPTPAKMTLTRGAFPCEKLSGVSSDGALATQAAQVICSRIAEEAGIACNIAEQAAFSLITDATLGENAYHLTVNEQEVRLAAADLRGFVLGAENLLKLKTGEGIPCCEIEDAPFLPFRGVHLMLPGPEEMEFARRLVRYVISPMGYNALILEIAGGMRFDSHPEITEAVIQAKRNAREGKWPAFPHASVGGPTCIEKADVAAFCDYVRSFGIDVIPEVQSLGHVQFMTLAHPDIAERDENADAVVDELVADVPPKRFYAHCYCPSNEKSYQILFDLMDEIIEVVRPQRYVHIGHDEVYQIGVCPLCREKDLAKLFAADVRRIYDRLATKGLKTMMWSDMLQPVTKYLTPAAADMLPKDILMLDFIWYFHMDKDIEKNLLDKDFSVAIGNLYSSHFPRYEQRIAQKGMCGGQCSAWVGSNEYALGKEGKLYDFLFTAQMLWSAAYTGSLRLLYDRAIKAAMPHLRARLRAQSELTGREITLFESDRKPPYTYAEEMVKVPLDTKCKALIFEHTATKKLTRIPWGPLDELGVYRVGYEDGSSEEIPVTYGGNIGHWARRQNAPLPGSYYRHNGYFCTYFTDGLESKMADGTPVCIYRYEWRNPHPEKRVCTVSFRKNETYDTQVCLLRLAAIVV